MLESALSDLLETPDAVVTRDKGAAFLAAACQIYGLSALTYFCINIPRSDTSSYVHYVMSDSFATQAVTIRPIHPGNLARIRLFRDSPLLRDDIAEIAAACDDDTEASASPPHTSPATLIKLCCHRCELALLAYGVQDAAAMQSEQREEIRILGSYFHGHMLRRNGGDVGDALLVSARELDCLRWAAAGKSAWEASIILGISQRTVRFHLNSAREKLNCANTTQAVAKAVSHQLIAV